MRKIVLFAVIGIFITGSVYVWADGYPAIRSKAKITVPKINPGLRVLVNEYHTVRVVNKKPIKYGFWSFKYGDTCRVDEGWAAEVVGTLKSNNSKLVLLRVIKLPGSGTFGCSQNILFFLPEYKVKQMLYKDLKRKADELAEKEAVKKLLKKNKKRTP